MMYGLLALLSGLDVGHAVSTPPLGVEPSDLKHNPSVEGPRPTWTQMPRVHYSILLFSSLVHATWGAQTECGGLRYSCGHEEGTKADDEVKGRCTPLRSPHQRAIQVTGTSRQRPCPCAAARSSDVRISTVVWSASRVLEEGPQTDTRMTVSRSFPVTVCIL